MDLVEFGSGYSKYSDKIVTDREICGLVGINNYQALRSFDEALFSKISNLEVFPENRGRVSIILMENNFNISELKASLIVRYIDGSSSPEANRTITLIEGSGKNDYQLVDSKEELSLLIVTSGIITLVMFALYNLN